MYRLFLRALAAIALLSTFWPVLRFAGLAAFDWLGLAVVIAAFPYRVRVKPGSASSFQTPLLGLLLLVCGAYLSVLSSWDPLDHVRKVAELFLDYSMMLSFAYVLSRKNILSLSEVLTLLAVSGAVSSVVCILQGQFGLLKSLMPPDEMGSLARMNGLTEWPIEAGRVSAYSAVISVGLAINRRPQWLLYVLLAVIDLYSMQYSASLTAVFGLIAGMTALLLFSKSYVGLFALGIAAFGLLAVALPSGLLGPLTSRLEGMARDQENYATLRIREIQWDQTVQLIDARTILLGNGYSVADLPGGDIHNAVLASVFHFGLVGLISQLLLIWFAVGRLLGDAPRSSKAILLGCICIFCADYLTGPAFARRALWIPLFLIAAYLPERRSSHSRPELLGRAPGSI